MNKIKFAVVGCGHIGKRHATIIEQNSEAELCALIDVKEKNTLNIDNFDVPFFNSLESFFNSNINADVICIATPNGLHFSQAMECLNHSTHIIIEKPISLNKLDAEKILHLAKEKNKKVFTVMQNRYSPPSVWIKSVIQSGILGEIFLVQINCFWNRDCRYYNSENNNWRGTKALDGGVLYTQFSHFIDILYWLFGDIKNVHSKLKNFNHQETTEFNDSGFATFDFVNGGMGELNFSTSVWNNNLESSLTIIAQNGSIKIGGQYMNEVQVCNIKNYQFETFDNKTEKCNDYGGYKGSAANHHFVIQNVINYLKGREFNLPDPKDSVHVIDIIERIYKAVN